ncbi:MAG TPA: 1,4-dihydroxy-2-naphthoate polyprenyltransferase [Mycobacteriales bacterium]|nr:1,4-dihydroxy-2-naphthoate polyprenyltransferase [Mycobacteriales bacterium]HVX69911.1 1,4-dihydroxy-2-naphthoate polyprenyltransferase [Mycobacteriales bacterium]
MSDEQPSRSMVWLEASRPRTLPASLAPVVVGTAAAAEGTGLSHVSWGRFGLVVVVAVAVQIAVNFANDYFDGVRGVDTVQRAGPRRAVASGLVTPQAMRLAIVVAMAVAAGAGLALAAVVSWWLLLVGAAAFVALLGYSGGPRPYASAGLGELFVFLFFGLVATLGSSYVQHSRLPATAWIAAVATGVLAVAILVVNNLRDVPTDAIAGKRTLAVRIGETRTRQLFVAAIAVGLGLAVIGEPVAARSAWPLLALLALPLAREPISAVRGGGVGRALIPALGGTGKLELAVAVLLAAGLLLG